MVGHVPKNQTPESDRAQADHERDLRQGSAALLYAIARAQAEREGRMADYLAMGGQL